MSDGAERLVFGTAALGMAYGLARREAVHTGAVDEFSAARLIRAGIDAGITTFDTAPAYGLAEARLGETLGSRGAVWTKVPDVAGSAECVQSLERSLAALRRPRIELLQWHNWSAASTDVTRACWSALERDGRVAMFGATTYGPHDARAAIESGLFGMVQVEWNLLNQRVVEAVAELARARGVRLAVRSVYLQGALTDEGRELPPLPALAEGVARVRRVAQDLGSSVTRLALRAALGHPAVAHVLVGFDRVEQVGAALSTANSEPLDAHAWTAVRGLDMQGDASADPSTWAKTG